MIQITKHGTVFPVVNGDLEKLKTEFKQKHFIKLPELLEPQLLSFIQEKLQRDKFLEDRYKVGDDDATGYRLEDDRIVGLLHFLLNDEMLFRLVEKITDCGKIGCFTGRVYTKIQNLGQYDSWHDDLTDDRMIAISINLSTEIYSGGDIEILDKRSNEIIKIPANKGFGDGIIFRLAPYLEHRVTKVCGKYPRTVLTGWFRSSPDYREKLFAIENKDLIQIS